MPSALLEEKIMTRYLVAIHHPDDYDPAALEDEAMHRDIDVLNEEMLEAGIRLFVGGLHPVAVAKSLKAGPGGEVEITDGPYLKTREHVGGFWVLEAADMDEALEWGRKAAIACKAPVEVRAFH
ncbi:YciI family protein [Agrobacterium sp. Ap1]|uniref:YciI family protein n=1 Tax=Agrobacterium sp. Ap1 TaxID=2815337 RepID=UPI002570B1B3|nr:YciI family protein [Agrobacterium sp. Ap1]